jgi:hypothetical protein
MADIGKSNSPPPNLRAASAQSSKKKRVLGKQIAPAGYTKFLSSDAANAYWRTIRPTRTLTIAEQRTTARLWEHYKMLFAAHL